MQTTAPRLRIAAVSMDCDDHRRLADFYVAVLGGELLWANEHAAAVRAGGYVLVPQHVDGYVAPTWPGQSILHLDLNGDGTISVADLVDVAIECGAKVAAHQPDDRWTVLLDPAGHPFCVTPFSPFDS